jgi:ADP-ribose pyrophosphatase
VPASSDQPPRILATGRYLELVDDHGWEYVRRVVATGVAVIVATTDAGSADGECLVLVEQHRVAVGRSTIELPAGLVGDHAGSADEPMEHAAARELEEETGFRATDWRLLTEGPPSSGLSRELVTFFRATGLTRVGVGGGDETENITVHVIRVAEVPAFLRRQAAAGVQVDPKVYVGLYFIHFPPARS